MVYKMLNMDFYFKQTHYFASEGLFQPPGAVRTNFMMDGWTFLGFQNQKAGHILI